MTRLHVPVTLRWSDLDAYAHVNNVAMFRLLEDARITAFWQHPEAPEGEAWPTAVVPTGPEADSHTLVAGQRIEYLRPLLFTRTPVRVEMWLGRIGGASAEVCYEVHDGAVGMAKTGPTTGGDPYARATTTLVFVDAATSKPRRLTEAERLAWKEFEEEPITFRHRG